MIADALMKYLDDQNAENYVQINLDSADHGNILLTLHRPNGKSPHELRREAERRAEKAEERIAEVERAAVAPAQKRPDAILVHLLESEVLTIVDELREATKEYRRRFDGYPTRLGRPWLLEYDALADRLDQAVTGDRGADRKSVRDDGNPLSGSGEA